MLCFRKTITTLDCLSNLIMISQSTQQAPFSLHQATRSIEAQYSHAYPALDISSRTVKIYHVLAYSRSFRVVLVFIVMQSGIASSKDFQPPPPFNPPSYPPATTANNIK